MSALQAGMLIINWRGQHQSTNIMFIVFCSLKPKQTQSHLLVMMRDMLTVFKIGRRFH